MTKILKQKLRIIPAISLAAFFSAMAVMASNQFASELKKKSVRSLLLKQNVKHTISFLKELPIDETVNLIAPVGCQTSYNIFLGLPRSNSKCRVGADQKISFLKFLDKHKLKVIIWPGAIGDDARYRQDKEYQFFLKNYRQHRFSKIRIPNTSRYVLLHESLQAQKPNGPKY